METSRDDFVIAIRSAFLKKGTQQRFSILSLILFSIIFLVLGSLNFKPVDYIKIGIKEIVYRSSFIISGPENFIKKNYFTIQSHLSLYEENKKNKFELENLKSQKLLNEFIILENKRLKSIIDDYLIKTDVIIAKILSDKQSPFLKSVIINKGSKHNIEMGMIVLDKNYLVGKVVEVNYISSRVLLLSDINSKIPVIIEPGNRQSILSGTGKNHGSIQYLKKESKILENSVVYTSGSAGLFKSGIPIGRIDDDKNIVFFSDFTQLDFVEIVSFKKTETK
jgi:rod shape-determining protein MreC